MVIPLITKSVHRAVAGVLMIKFFFGGGRVEKTRYETRPPDSKSSQANKIMS